MIYKKNFINCYDLVKNRGKCIPSYKHNITNYLGNEKFTFKIEILCRICSIKTNIKTTCVCLLFVILFSPIQVQNKHPTSQYTLQSKRKSKLA